MTRPLYSTIRPIGCHRSDRGVMWEPIGSSDLSPGPSRRKSSSAETA
jgi:hypothetical protein